MGRAKQSYLPIWKRLSPPDLPKSSRDKIVATLKSGSWDYGKSAKYLEASIAERLDVPKEWVIATSSCTAALAAATFFQDFDEPVRVPHMTYMATYAWPCNIASEVPEDNDREPVRIDCSDAGWPEENCDIGVDLWGRAYHAAGRSRPSILDAAHRAFAPEHGGLVHAGTSLCYSFGPIKEFASPAGGAIISNEFADVERRSRYEAWLRCGQAHRGEYHPGMGGIKGLMSDVSATAIRAQLTRESYLRAARTRILETYENFLGSLLVTKPGEASGHLAVLRFSDEGWANLVKKRLSQHNIQWSIHYRIHELWGKTHAFDLSRRILSIPCHSQMKPFHAARIARLVLTV